MTTSEPVAARRWSGRYPLVGRDAEVEQLLAAIGPGRVVVVEGEPGVGKTRLVEEVARAPGPPAR